ncbi:MAG: glycosyltransferase family A protein, partial [Saprospiraceae bacterium]
MFDHSFAVMVYGDSPFLVECLDSLVLQTVKSHIYIATSTPSDYITSIANRYNIDVYINKDQHGIAHDWNFSLSKCKTDFVTLTHQDDVYLPNY